MSGPAVARPTAGGVASDCPMCPDGNDPSRCGYGCAEGVKGADENFFVLNNFAAGVNTSGTWALFLVGYPQPVTVSGATFAKLGTQGRGLGGWGADIQKPTGHTQFDVDDLAWAFIRFDNGAVIQFQVSWAVNNKDQFFTELYGTQGGALVGDQDKVELYTSLNGQPSDIQVTVPRSGVGSYQHLVNNLVRHLDGDPTAEIVTPEQALVSAKIMDAIQRSAQIGREVEI